MATPYNENMNKRKKRSFLDAIDFDNYHYFGLREINHDDVEGQYDRNKKYYDGKYFLKFLLMCIFFFFVILGFMLYSFRK